MVRIKRTLANSEKQRKECNKLAFFSYLISGMLTYSFGSIGLIFAIIGASLHAKMMYWDIISYLIKMERRLK